MKVESQRTRLFAVPARGQPVALGRSIASVSRKLRERASRRAGAPNLTRDWFRTMQRRNHNCMRGARCSDLPRLGAPQVSLRTAPAG
jgi:hypothetical protein